MGLKPHILPKRFLAEELAAIEFAQDLFDGPIESVDAGNGHRRSLLRGQNVEVGHGFGRGFELVAYGLFGTAALAHVAVDAASEADVMRGFDVDAEVVERDELGEMEREDAFDDDETCGGDGLEGAEDAGVGREIVNGTLDGAAGGERADVLDEELALERIRMVEVLLVAGVERELGEVAVIEVQREESRVELRGELAGERGFARAGAAGDADDSGVV